jgi:predicted O-methyltransferase YrrM
MSVVAPPGFDAALVAVQNVEGWLSDDQAHLLWERASLLSAPATVVEIGSYRGRSAIVLARAVTDGVAVVAIDPHAGNDRGAREIHGTPAEGEADYREFHANLERTGVARRVRHVRQPSEEAHSEVAGPIDLLYVDGAHRYQPARHDLERWGARVAPGGTMLVHDAFSSIGVTLALVRLLFASGDWRYVGRARTLAEYRREPVRGTSRLRNAGRQLAQLPWFVRNLAVKLALVARLRPVARLLRSPDWPY